MRIKETILTGTAEAIIEGSADLVISGPLPKGFLGESLGVVQMIPVAHSGHPLVNAEQRVTQKDLASELQIVIRDSGKAPQENQGWLRSEQRWTLDSFDAALELLQTGLGFCWLPNHRVEPLIAAGYLRQIQFEGGRDRLIPLHLVVPRPDQLGPCGRELLMQLRDLEYPAQG